MTMKTNTGLVEYAKAQLGLPYWYGTFGNIATADLYDSKRRQYPALYKPWNDFPSQYGKRVHDCVGLIKGYLWSDSATSKPIYNASQDVSANGMRSKCSEKGAIGTMPDIPGVLVFMPGHVGVYIGGGKVVEARGHEYGVVCTELSKRPWKHWGKCPWINYSSAPGGKTITVKTGTWNVRKGAGKQYDVKGYVNGGTKLVYSKINDGWYYIPQLDGWVSAKGVM